MPLCPLQGYRIRINQKLWFETQQSTSFRAIQCSEYGAVYGVRWAIHHLLSTSSSCWKSIMAKPAKESWQVWYWAIKVWWSYLDFSNSIPIPHPLTQNYQPDIKISRDIQPLLGIAVSSNILLRTSILLCHTLRQFCRFVSQHQKDCRLQKEKEALLWVFLLTMLSESAAWAKLPVAFGTRQFQVILPTVSLKDSGVLKFLFAHFAGKSDLVHYMYHCLVFSQSFFWMRSIVVFQITTSDLSLYDSPVMDTGA